MSVKFNLDMEMYYDNQISEDKKLLTIELNGMDIEFKLSIENQDNSFLDIDWRNITLDGTKVIIGPNGDIKESRRANKQTAAVIDWF